MKYYNTGWQIIKSLFMTSSVGLLGLLLEANKLTKLYFA